MDIMIAAILALTRRAPVLFVIDATSRQVVQTINTGNNAHSVAVDPVSNHIFVPIAGPDGSCPTGCIAVYAGVATDQMGVSTSQ